MIKGPTYTPLRFGLRANGLLSGAGGRTAKAAHARTGACSSLDCERYCVCVGVCVCAGKMFAQSAGKTKPNRAERPIGGVARPSAPARPLAAGADN